MIEEVSIDLVPCKICGCVYQEKGGPHRAMYCDHCGASFFIHADTLSQIAICLSSLGRIRFVAREVVEALLAVHGLYKDPYTKLIMTR